MVHIEELFDKGDEDGEKKGGDDEEFLSGGKQREDEKRDNGKENAQRKEFLAGDFGRREVLMKSFDDENENRLNDV